MHTSDMQEVQARASHKSSAAIVIGTDALQNESEEMSEVNTKIIRTGGLDLVGCDFKDIPRDSWFVLAEEIGEYGERCRFIYYKPASSSSLLNVLAFGGLDGLPRERANDSAFCDGKWAVVEVNININIIWRPKLMKTEEV